MDSLDACIKGDKDAWDAFVARWAGVIYAAVGRTMKGRAQRTDVEDTVQEVFVRLLRDDRRLLRTYDPARASLATWLTMVARSVTIDRHRRRRPPALPLESHDGVVEPPDTGPSLSVPLHLLTARQRLVLRLLFDEDMTVEQAARFLGVDNQTVRSTKHKALTRLRTHLERPDSRSEGMPARPGP